MTRTLIAATALVLLLSSGIAGAADLGWVELIDYHQITSGPDAGMYEYVYDVYNDVDSYIMGYFDMYFDATGVVNQFAFDWNGDGTAEPNGLTQNWSAVPAGVPRMFGGGYIDPNRWPSYWEDTDGDFVRDSWVQPTSGPNAAWAMDNIWHAGGDYISNGLHTWERGYADDQGIHWLNQRTLFMGGLADPGLMFTFRIVHPMPKGTDNIQWQIYTDTTTNLPYYGMVNGPVPEPATMSLLAIGGVALLKRRRRA